MVYQPIAAKFDGSTHLTRGADLTGSTDSKEFLIAFWLKRGNDGILQNIYTGSFFQVTFESNDRLRILGANVVDGIIVDILTSPITDTAQHFFCASADTGSTTAHMYVDDAEDLNIQTALVDGVIDFTFNDHTVGGTDSGSLLYTGCLADFLLDYGAGTYLDLSVEANRRTLIGAGALASVDYSSRGSSSLVFLSGEIADWHTNEGTGGGFVENGALTACATNPVGSDGLTQGQRDFSFVYRPDNRLRAQKPFD